MTAPTQGTLLSVGQFQLVTTGSSSQSFSVLIEHSVRVVNGTKGPMRVFSPCVLFGKLVVSG